jgi:uncharacterized membrane protein YdcZ (DUF606 family)
MNSRKIAGIALVVAGVLGLLYGSFSYTRDSHMAQLGNLEMTVRDTETVNIPRWAGIAALVAGGLLLFLPMRKS